jgi:hypothetical protein
MRAALAARELLSSSEPGTRREHSIGRGQARVSRSRVRARPNISCFVILMFRDSKIVRGLADWLLSGISSRLEFLERDIQGLQGDTGRLRKDQEGLTRVVGDHHAQLQQHAAALQDLSQLHKLLAGRVGQEFPGQQCKACGSAMVFERAALRKAYTLSCPNSCGDTLVLPEKNLLETIRKIPPPG